MSYPSCIYKFEKKQKSVTHVCFAKLPQKSVEFVKYVCKVDKDLTLDQVNFYLNFMNKFLDKKRYTYRIFLFPSDPKFKIRIYFQLNAQGFERVQTLLYLTAFRYPQEFIIFIQEMYKTPDITPTELFVKFQELHLQVISGKLKDKYGTLGGHGLIYVYPHSADFKNFKPKSLRKFRQDIKTVKTSVQSYFKE